MGISYAPKGWHFSPSGNVLMRDVPPPVTVNPTPNSFSKDTSSVVDTLLGLQSNEQKELGDETQAQAGVQKANLDAQAAALSGQGYTAEQQMYTNAATSSEEDAAISVASGQIQAYQDMRKVLVHQGQQAAAIAGNGFKNSGSALYLAKSSLQQGLLTNALDLTNADEKAVGYLETAAANRAQASAAGAAAQQSGIAQQAAGVASSAAQALAQQDASAATTTKTNADNLSTALTDYFKTVDPNSVTPEDQLTMSLLSSNPDKSLSDTANKLSTTAREKQTTWDAAALSNSGATSSALGTNAAGTTVFGGANLPSVQGAI